MKNLYSIGEKRYPRHHRALARARRGTLRNRSKRGNRKVQNGRCRSGPAVVVIGIVAVAPKVNFVAPAELRHFFARFPTRFAICIDRPYPVRAFYPVAERDIRREGGRGRRLYDYARARRQIRRTEVEFSRRRSRTSNCFHEIDLRKPRVTRRVRPRG